LDETTASNIEKGASIVIWKEIFIKVMNVSFTTGNR
jgi:hypothetical protein